MYLLYSRVTATTGRNLKRILGIRGSTNPPEERQDIMIRWGSIIRTPRRADTVINKRESIELTLDKLGSLRLFRDHNVPVPRAIRLTEGSAEAMQYPALARKRNHHQALDVVLCMQVEDAVRAMNNGSEYLVEYVPTRAEYRIHVFREEVIKSSQKTLRDPATTIPWVRNHDHGYIFTRPRIRPSRRILNAAIDAVASADLDFGAVDVLLADDGFPYVLEVNTGPGLVASGLRKYSEKFAEVLQLNHINEEVLEEVQATQNGDEEDE